MTPEGSRKFLATPGKWPRYPYCPLKRTTGRTMEFATVLITADGLVIGYENGKDIAKHVTVEEIIHNGWRVD